MLVKDDFSEFWLMGDIFASLTSSQYVFSFFFFWRREGVLEVMRKVLMENILFDQDSISNHIEWISEKEFNVCLKNKKQRLFTIGIS